VGVARTRIDTLAGVIKRRVLRSGVVAAVLFGAVPLAMVDGAVGSGASGFACPNVLPATGHATWRMRPDHHGMTFCDDGATATVTMSDGTRVVFRGGVCTASPTGRFISIGTLIFGPRREIDPRGFNAVKYNAISGKLDSASFALRGTYWVGVDDLAVTWSGLAGSWSGGDIAAVMPAHDSPADAFSGNGAASTTGLGGRVRVRGWSFQTSGVSSVRR
jgi:hypothetical protein